MFEQQLYNSPANRLVISMIPESTRTLLDVGCGTGALARELSESVQVDGITLNNEENKLARHHCRCTWTHDLEQGLPKIDGKYDVIVMSHVLEHIANPHKLMSSVDEILGDGGMIICAIPNMLFLYNRLKLFAGRVEYDQHGIMDYTHVRWYTRKSCVAMFVHYGFELDAVLDNGNVPLGPVRRMIPKSAEASIDRTVVNWFPGLLAWEFVCRFKRSVVAN